MKNKDMTFFQRIMEEMDSEQLNEMLQDELQKDIPDGDAVRMALRVLESRERIVSSEIGRDTEEAWKKYQANSETVPSAPVKKRGAVLKAASIALILGVLLFAVPQTVQASGLFDRIAQWTDSFFELFAPEDDTGKHSEYVFKTDNLGLQQVYDAVVELGVSEPVVPMWLPGDYLIADCEVSDKTDWTRLTSIFTDGEDEVVMQINVFSQNAPSAYYKDDGNIEIYEEDGIEYSIMRNNDWWVVIWVNDKVECAIMLDCQEVELYRMIDSIYSLEDE